MDHLVNGEKITEQDAGAPSASLDAFRRAGGPGGRSSIGNSGVSSDYAADSDCSALETVSPAAHRTAKRLKSTRSGESVVVETQRLDRIEMLIEKQIDGMENFKSLVKLEVNSLRSVCDDRAERAASFESEVMDRIERESRKCDLVFRGIPLGPNVKVFEIEDVILKLSAYLKVTLEKRNIVFVRKIAGKRMASSSDSVIIVRFTDQAVRRSLLMAFIRAKVVTAQALGFSTTDRITVSDNLTPRNAAIRSRAAQLRSEGVIDLFTIRDGLVSVLFRDARYTIKSLNELNTLVNQTILSKSLDGLSLAKK